jgi:protease IV
MEMQNESIFVSALRGFCRSLFIMLGLFAAITIALFVFYAFSSPYQPEEKTTLVILPDLEGHKSIAPLNSPAILRIDIHGVIGDPQHLNSGIVQSILLDSREGLLQHNRVKGILLHFDTPGGTVLDSDNIYRMLLKYKEKFKVPIFGYIDGMCASGGMYVASAADHLYCGSAGIVGSVGVVFGPFFNVYDAITKIGVQARTLTEGLDKDMMNPFRPWKPVEDETLKKVMSHFYQQFVDIVTSARPRLNKLKLVEEYGAKIFDGPTAMDLGYIDFANSDYDTALLSLMKEAKIDPAKPYQIVEFQPRRGVLTELVEGRSPLLTGKVEHSLRIGSDQSFMIKDQFAYLYQP